jgi:hypothetical protein
VGRADPNYKSNSRVYGLPKSGSRPFGQSERFRPAMSSAPWVGEKADVEEEKPKRRVKKV